MAFFDRLKDGLKKTKDAVFGQVNNIFKAFVKVDEELLEELEELLIMADTGVASAEDIIEKLQGVGADIRRINDHSDSDIALTS